MTDVYGISRRTTGVPIDSVCRMEASESDEVTTEFEGTTYDFCSADCRDFFGEHPGRFADDLHDPTQ